MITPEALDLRDKILDSVSREMDVPVSDILRLRSRNPQTMHAQQVAMWVVREVLEQSDEVPALEEVEVHELFGTRLEVVDHACLKVQEHLREIAHNLLKEHRPATSKGWEE